MLRGPCETAIYHLIAQNHKFDSARRLLEATFTGQEESEVETPLIAPILSTNWSLELVSEMKIPF